MRIISVQGHRVESGRQALCRRVFRQCLKTTIGSERVALSCKHPSRVFTLALERKHPGCKRKMSRQVLSHHPAQQIPLILIARQGYLSNDAATEGFVNQ